jgi:hypothetical protein
MKTLTYGTKYLYLGYRLEPIVHPHKENLSLAVHLAEMVGTNVEIGEELCPMTARLNNSSLDNYISQTLSIIKI